MEKLDIYTEEGGKNWKSNQENVGHTKIGGTQGSPLEMDSESSGQVVLLEVEKIGSTFKLHLKSK